ncbi:MAG: hypothetical protein KI790_03880 [Cyclobacteriaceae bacterium]|nr:hypothetical protein [Cyclobacteriaceae bacterium HetDA_MAG_MS6]
MSADRYTILLTYFLFSFQFSFAQPHFPSKGADEKTPSKSQYFSWINHTNEGASESQTLANLDFFKWLADTYGMSLDLYAFDAGTIDGRNFYGKINSGRFRQQFPNGLDSINRIANNLGIRLGIWAGPDGFGHTPQDESSRKELMVSFCRDYNFGLFKFDGVCGYLRPDRQSTFTEMIKSCKYYAPDLIILNHRLDLGTEGNKLMTTSLLGGRETYIDVHMSNEITATHHRVGALGRSTTPNLTRLTEDHGVCLSSCLDFWEDDLVLQAFNRNLILAPQIYGNPWLLSDEELPRLARLFNLHDQYNAILVDGMALEETRYGSGGVSRGHSRTRIVTLRNLTWNAKTIALELNESLGLMDNGKPVIIHQYHPSERFLGRFVYGSEPSIVVDPFRSALFKVTNEEMRNDEVVISGTDYEIIIDNDLMTEINLLGLPGETKKIKFENGFENHRDMTIGGTHIRAQAADEIEIRFPGQKLKNDVHRLIGDMQEIEIPEDAFSLYEATQFAADNNSLEARSLSRSGHTHIPQVKQAREAFFGQKTFVDRETWDRYMFDGDFSTQFSISMRYETFDPMASSFRINFGKKTAIDSLKIYLPDTYSLQPYNLQEGEYINVSTDLVQWSPVKFITDSTITIRFPEGEPIQYLTFPFSFLRVSEIVGYHDGREVEPDGWTGSNLQRPYVYDWHWDKQRHYYARRAWKLEFEMEELPDNSYLCVAINGTHGVEGAMAALKMNGKYLGSPDRSPSFRSNTWEYKVIETDKNYTYYFPLSANMVDKRIEAYVLAFFEEHLDLDPQVWISSYPHSFKKVKLVLSKK